MSQQARRERKVVTVLFADLVGFTLRAEALDPEDVEAILRPYHERLRSELERHGGTVEKFIGDAVVALFGVPAAHEDDPERAVRAALAVQDAISVLNESHPDLALQVRIGIGTGEVLVALEARPGEGEHTASGDVMNTAARLQQAAPAGGVLVGELTYRATRDAIEYGQDEAVGAKGKAEPVRAWPAVAPRSPLGVDVVQRGPSELVGREGELRLLRDALDRARRERTPQLVTLVGVPGIGKSRLTFELLSSLGEEEALWRQGRCLPYGDGVTFWALGEIVKSHAGIFESDPAEEAETKLASALGGLLADEQERAWVGEHVRPLVGLGSATEPASDRQLEDFAAWRRLLEAIAEQTPLVLVIEDLHWADEQLLGFVDHLVDWARDVPLMVLCTARPELLERRAGWGGGKPNSATISLAPLSDGETAQLLSMLLARSLFSPERQDELLACAGGNPLYAEQYARMLAERAAGDALPLPETVHGIIAARLDALEQPEKELLQNAAVVGKVFWTGCLAAMDGDDRFLVEELLHGLERKEFVRRQRRSSVAGESEHAFRHVLVREVAYSQIPRASRADKHRRAAEWIEALAEDRDDHVETLAHHYATALELARASGQPTEELEERARHAMADAAARTFALRSYLATRNFAEAALGLAPTDLLDRAQLLYLRALAEARLNDTDEEHLANARDALVAAGEPDKAATVSVFLADHLRSTGQEWAPELAQALAMVETAAPSSEKGWVLARAAWNHEFARDHPLALDLARKALDVGQAIDDDEVRAHALDAIAAAKSALGQDGSRELEQSIAAAEKAQSPQLMMNALGNSAIVEIDRGHLREATRLMEKAGAVARKYGNAWGVTWTAIWPIELEYLEGRWEQAARELDRYLHGDVGDFGFAGVGLNARSVALRLRLGQGEWATALAASEQYLADVRRAGERRMIPDALAVRARILAEARRSQEAAALLEECVQELEERGGASTGSPPWWLLDVVATTTRLGRPGALKRILALTPVTTPWLDGCRACADEDFVRAANIYAGIGARSEEALARLWAAERLFAAGRRREGEAERAQALEFFKRAAAQLYIEQAEALSAAPG